MSNPIKNAFDIMNIRKDIEERRQIINRYEIYGVLDRDDDIRKITSLRLTDEAVGTVSALTAYGPPLDSLLNHQLIKELQIQIDILEAELSKKLEEDKPHAHS